MFNNAGHWTGHFLIRKEYSMPVLLKELAISKEAEIDIIIFDGLR